MSTRLANYDQSVGASANLLLGSIPVGPNNGLMIMAKGTVAFQLKAVQTDDEDDEEFESDVFDVPTTGGTFRIAPGGTLVRLYAITVGASVIKCRVFPRYTD